MRITCPNCKATYEVGDADIPDDGIEVECSACLKRWNQMPAGFEAEDAPAEAETPPVETTPEVAAVTEPAPDAEPTPEPVEAETQEPIAPEPVQEPEPIASATVPAPEEAGPFDQDHAVVDFPSASSTKTTDWEAPGYDPNWESKGPSQPSAPAEIDTPKDIAAPSSPEASAPAPNSAPAPKWEEPVYDPNWESKGPSQPTASAEIAPPKDEVPEALKDIAEPSSPEAPAPEWETPVYDPNWESKGVSQPSAPSGIDAPKNTPEPSPPETPSSAPDWEAPVYDPDWENHEKSELAAPNEMNAPTDLTGEPEDEADLAPSAGWRVPKPPDITVFKHDPLDEILAEVNAEVEPSVPDEPVDVAPAAAKSVSVADADPTPAPAVANAPEAAAMPSSPEIEPDVPPVADAQPVPPAPDVEPSTPSAPVAEAPSETDDAEVSAPSDVDSIAEAVMRGVAEMEAKAQAGMEAAPVAPPQAEPVVAEVYAQPEPAPTPEPEPEPVIPHWSELAGSLAPVVAKAVPAKPQVQEATEEATKDIESFIRERAGNAAEAAAPDAFVEDAPAASLDEEEVFHPWDGEVAPAVMAEPVPEPAPEEDEFEWDEPPNADTPLTFDPAPDKNDPLVEQHIAALDRQNQEDLHPEPPEASNVIQAVIPQAPLETIPSGNIRPIAPKPRKPTPVDSAEDVEAAIRAQLTNMKKPKAPPKPVSAPAKAGIFAKLAKSKAPAAEAPAPAPQPVAAAPKPVDPLKAALADFGEDRSSGSGKRRGFMLVMVLFMLALVIYVFGGMISGMVPALEPFISGFSGIVDGLREMTQGLFGG